MLGQSAAIPAGRVVEADVYADGTLELGPGAALRAALASSDIKLGRNSSVLRWLHADGKRLSAAREYGLRTSVGGRIDSGSSAGAGLSGCMLLAIFHRGWRGRRICRMRCGSRTHSARQSRASIWRWHLRGRRVGFVASADSRAGKFCTACGRDSERECDCHAARYAWARGARLSGQRQELWQTRCLRKMPASTEASSAGRRCDSDSARFVAGPVMAEGDVMIARGSRVGGPMRSRPFRHALRRSQRDANCTGRFGRACVEASRVNAHASPRFGNRSTCEQDFA